MELRWSRAISGVVDALDARPPNDPPNERPFEGRRGPSGVIRRPP
jgi:hypothetical protein